MPRIVLVVHPERPAAWELARTATRWWQSRGREVVEVRGPAPETPFAETDHVEFAISLGGDGTMLRTVESVLSAGAGARCEPGSNGLSHRCRTGRDRAGF